MKNGNKNGKVHLRAPGRPSGARYSTLLCTSKRARRAIDTELYRNYGTVPVRSRCKLCHAIYKRLRRNGGKHE